MPELLGAPLGGGEHLGHEVGGDQRRRRAGSARRRGSRCRPGRRRARAPSGRLRLDRVDHPGRDGHRRAAQRVGLRRSQPGGLLGPAGCGSRCGIRRVAVIASSPSRSSLPSACAAAASTSSTAFGHLEAGEPLGAVTRAAPAASGGGRAGTTRAVDRLAPLGVRAAEHAGLGHRRVLEQHRLDLGGRDVLAAGDDRVDLAADHDQAARSSRRPRSPVRSVPPPATVGPATRISPSGAIATSMPGSGRPAVSTSPGSATRDLRARLGEPVGRGDRAAGVAGALEQRGRRGRAAEQDRAQPRAGRARPRRAGAASWVGTSEASVTSSRAPAVRSSTAVGAVDRASAAAPSARRRARAAAGTASARRGRSPSATAEPQRVGLDVAAA